MITYETPFRGTATERDRRPDERSMRRERRSRFLRAGREGLLTSTEGDICLSFWRLSSSKIYRGIPVLSLEICYARSSGKGIWENSRLGMYRCRRDCWSTVDLFVLFFPGETMGPKPRRELLQVEIVSLFSVIEKSRFLLCACLHSCAVQWQFSRSIRMPVGEKLDVICIVISKMHSYIWRECKNLKEMWKTSKRYSKDLNIF